jgi:hypothetical protein
MSRPLVEDAMPYMQSLGKQAMLLGLCRIALQTGYGLERKAKGNMTGVQYPL